MCGEGTGALTTIIGRINQRDYIDVLEHFFIPSIEDHFGDDDVIFQDDNASCHTANLVKGLLQNRSINTLVTLFNSPGLNHTENV